MTSDRADAVPGTSARNSGVDGAPVSDAADQLREVRQFLLRAWGELLRCSGLTDHSDFFTRGGDSLLMARLVRRIGEEFGVTVSLYAMSRRSLGDQALLVHQLRSRMRARDATPLAATRNVGAFVRATWSEVLGCATLTRTSDFFALGGDSLLMARVVRRLEHEFGVKMPVHDLLAAPTLGEQTLLVRAHVEATARGAARRRGRAA
ncbi:acyl carrier protein [Streptomyces sp. O3]